MTSRPFLRSDRRRLPGGIGLAAAAAGLALASSVMAQGLPAASSSPGASPQGTSASDSTRWSRCVTLGRSTTAVAQTQDWDGMEALAQQQLAECSWNAEMKLDALENLADAAVMRGDVVGALDQTERCLAENAQRTGCLITHAFVLAQVQRPVEARTVMQSAQAALAQETREYARRYESLTTSGAGAAVGATPSGAAALAAGSIPTGAPDELRAVQLQSVEDYRVKLTHYSGVINEMSRALGVGSR